MSGGVDSSLAAALLAQQGHEVIGATMKLFCYGDGPLPDRPCCSLESIRDAQAVAERLGIPHYLLDLQERFARDVVADFVSEYARGRTPIPCTRCNSFTKFTDLLAHADALGCDAIATGHYARVAGGRLFRGADRAKDQSYFLWGLRRAALARIVLPVGGLTKVEARAQARRLGLVTAEKPESQEICFVPGGDYMAILRQHLPADAPALARGPIVATDGTVVGEHDGFARYTVGQRRDLPGGRARPWYVVAIRPETRVVVVGDREELGTSSVRIAGANWLDEPLRPGATCEVQLRHRAKSIPASVLEVPDSGVSLALEEPASAVAPGQSGVLYRGEQVVGGGVID